MVNHDEARGEEAQMVKPRKMPGHRCSSVDDRSALAAHRPQDPIAPCVAEFCRHWPGTMSIGTSSYPRPVSIEPPDLAVSTSIVAYPLYRRKPAVWCGFFLHYCSATCSCDRVLIRPLSLRGAPRLRIGRGLWGAITASALWS